MSNCSDLFAPISHLLQETSRNWLPVKMRLRRNWQQLALGLTLEMVARERLCQPRPHLGCVSKCEVITQFRNTIGLKGHLDPFT
jgi:ethanolamine ammonia-lyase large subunit